MTELARAHQDRLMQYLAYGFLFTCLLSLLLLDRRSDAPAGGDVIVSTENTRAAPPDDLNDTPPPPVTLTEEPRTEPIETGPAETGPTETAGTPVPAAPADIRTIERAIRAVMRTYRDAGMAGLNAAIDRCYERALALRTLPALAYCFVLDDGAAGLELAFSQSVHLAPNARNTREAADGRIADVWRQLQFSDMELEQRKDEWRKISAQTLDRILAADDAARTGYVYDDGDASAGLSRPRDPAVDPAAPLQEQRETVAQLIAEGTLAHAEASVETFRSLADAQRAARNLPVKVPDLPGDIIKALNRRFVIARVAPAPKTGESRTILYVSNTSDQAVSAIIVDLADQPCGRLSSVNHIYHVVRRRDGTAFDPRDDVALLSTVPMVSDVPHGHCSRIVDAVPPVNPADIPPAVAGDGMTFSLHARDYRPRRGLTAWIFADGEITDDTPRRFEDFVREAGIGPGARVILNSPGGKVAAGMELGDAIRRLGLHTDIGRRKGTGRDTSIVEGECDSSCAIAFLGGTFRHLHQGSTYGVHRFWVRQSEDDTVDAGQVMAATLLTYVTRQGVTADLAARMAQTPSNQIEYIPLSELIAMHVVTGGVDSETWSLESAHGRIYVAGERHDQHGTQKFMLLCKREVNQLMATAVTAFPDAMTATQAADGAQSALYADDALSPLRGGDQPALSVRDQSVWAQWSLTRDDIAFLLAAKATIGFTLMHPAEQRSAGFHITLGDGRKVIRDYATDCFRKATR